MYNKQLKTCSIMFTILAFLLIVLLSVGITMDKYVYNNQFHQYSINVCDPNKCVPVNQTSDPINIINKTNHTTYPLCSYALGNIITGMCISPALSLQNGLMCTGT